MCLVLGLPATGFMVTFCFCDWLVCWRCLLGLFMLGAVFCAGFDACCLTWFWLWLAFWAW